MNHFTNIDQHDKYPADKQFVKMLEENFKQLNLLAYLAFQYNRFHSNDCLVLQPLDGIVVISRNNTYPMIVKVDNPTLLNRIIFGRDTGDYELVENYQSITITGEDETEYKDVLSIDMFKIQATTSARKWNFYQPDESFREMLLFVMQLNRKKLTKENGGITATSYVDIYDNFIQKDFCDNRVDVWVNMRSKISFAFNDATEIVSVNREKIEELGVVNGVYPLSANVFLNHHIAAYFYKDNKDCGIMLKTFGATISPINLTVSGTIPIQKYSIS
jgi:hypothetical protein